MCKALKAAYSAPSAYRQPHLNPVILPNSATAIRHRFSDKSRKTNLNSPVSTAHNYLLTAVY